MSDSDLPFLGAARRHPDRTALIFDEREYLYCDLLALSERVAHFLLRGRTDLEGARVVLLVPPGVAYVAAQWGIWRAGGVVVPLALAPPVPELVSLIVDADPELVLLHPGTEEKAKWAAQACGVRWAHVEDALRRPGRASGRTPDPASGRAPDPASNGSRLHISAPTPGRGFGISRPGRGSGIPRPAAPAAPPLPAIYESRPAHIIYTSGTTGRPKGVVTTHAHTRHQVESIAEAWEIRQRDTVLNALPLHHVHGIINALLCPLWCGARVEILPRFDADEVWKRFEVLSPTVFMGVPTMYVRLIRAWEEASPERRRELTDRARWLRLTISGSAALPGHIHGRWAEATEHSILERYGLTETGMVLTNPLYGHRPEGFVGQPFPFVDVRLRGDGGREALPGEEGSIEVRGPGVFSEYWRRPEETAAAFREDGWFRTGDRAVVHPEHGYRILGRESVDIIKTGGEKVSALEIENVLRLHPRIEDCAVVGIPDDEWGERVSAAVVVTPERAVPASELRAWVKRYLAGYKAPARIMVLEALPRNSMGKVLKTQVRDLFLRAP